MAAVEYLRMKDLAREWGVSVNTVRNWIKRWGIRCKRPTKRTLLVSRAESDRLMKRAEAKYGGAL